MDKQLIAPCGMNCGICYAYLRKKKPCPGCAGEDSDMATSCRECFMRNCETIKSNHSGFCYECQEFPCKKLKQMDKRYATKYHMSVLENLDIIKEQGIDALVAREREKWKCPECGGVISCHNGICYTCGLEQLKNRKSTFSWENK